MATIRVTSQVLTDMAGTVSAGQSNIEGELAALLQQINSLPDTWAGTASDQFQQYYAQWNSGASNLQQALEGISQLLANAAEAYAETESEIASSLHKG